MDKSQLSAASRARRDEIRTGTPFSVAGVQHQLDEVAPPMVLSQAEADGWVRLPADALHYKVDGTIWFSYCKFTVCERDPLESPVNLWRSP